MIHMVKMSDNKTMMKEEVSANTEASESINCSTDVVSILQLGQSELPQTSQTLTAFIAGKNTIVVFFRSGEYQSRNSTGTYGDNLATGKYLRKVKLTHS